LERLKLEEPMLIILDVDMPGLDGWRTLAELRRGGCTQPVLMFTHAEDTDSKVRFLQAGADDYIGKSADSRELLARIGALLRRAGPPPGKITPLVFGDLRIDLEHRTATKGSAPMKLTRTDYALLRLLRANEGRPVSREQIIATIWGGKSGNSHALDTHLWRLRKKLGDTAEEPRLIHNVAGIGYVMTPPGQAR
jgi:two-component system, OmpR family, response regulator MprA